MNEWRELYRIGEVQVENGTASNLMRRFVKNYRTGYSQGLREGLRTIMTICLGPIPNDADEKIDVLTPGQVKELITQSVKARTFDDLHWPQ